MSDYGPYGNMKIHYSHQLMISNPRGRDFVCGDLQGCYDELMEALSSVDFDEDTDRLFCLGDVVDRGMKSLECLRLLKKPWFHSLLGNHEQMMMNAIEPPFDTDSWYKAGGDWHSRLTRRERDIAWTLCKSYVEHLPLSITIMDPNKQTVGLIHAVPPDDWFDAVTGSLCKENAMWGDPSLRPAFDPDVKNVGVVLVGHKVGNYIRKVGNVFMMDTGAGFKGGKLTVIELKELSVEYLTSLQEESKRTYHTSVKEAEKEGLDKPTFVYEQVNPYSIGSE